MFFMRAALFFGLLVQLPISAATLGRVTEFWDLSEVVTELSGFATDARRRTLWAVGDGGNGPYLFELNLAKKSSRVVRVKGAKNIDWEGVVYGPGGMLWILDTGNNDLDRDVIRLLGIKVSDLSEDTVEVSRTLIVTWPGEYRDVEAGFIHRGKMILVTKEPDKKPRLLKVNISASAPEEQEAQKWGVLPHMPAVTDAAKSPSGTPYLLTDKGVFEIKNLEGVEDREVVQVAGKVKGELEALAVLSNGRFLVGAESGKVYSISK